MAKNKKGDQDIKAKISEVMSLMGKRSAAARKKRWGEEEFQDRMRRYGKLGGRPKKSKTT
jgi:hypothetical protein